MKYGKFFVKVLMSFMAAVILTAGVCLAVIAGLILIPKSIRELEDPLTVQSD